MISLKIKKYRPYADVTMVVNEDVEIHLGMLSVEQLTKLYDDMYDIIGQLDSILNEYFNDE